MPLGVQNCTCNLFYLHSSANLPVASRVVATYKSDGAPALRRLERGDCLAGCTPQRAFQLAGRHDPLARVYLRREIRRLSGPIPLLGRHIGRLDSPNFLGYGFCEPTADKRGLGDTAIPIALCTAELLERPGHV